METEHRQRQQRLDLKRRMRQMSPEEFRRFQSAQDRAKARPRADVQPTNKGNQRRLKVRELLTYFSVSNLREPLPQYKRRPRPASNP